MKKKIMDTDTSLVCGFWLITSVAFSERRNRLPFLSELKQPNAILTELQWKDRKGSAPQRKPNNIVNQSVVITHFWPETRTTRWD